MQKIHIVGAGGLGKEAISYILDEAPRRYEILGAWAPEAFNHPRYNELYRGDLNQLRNAIQPEDKLLLCIAHPKAKENVLAELDDLPKDLWTTYIHPSAEVSSFATIGTGCLITPQCIVTSDAILGDFVFMNTGSVIGHDAVLGDRITLFPNSEICGECEVGSGSVFGIGAFVLPGVSLPEKTKVMAGAVVWESQEEPCKLQGNPATVVA